MVWGNGPVAGTQTAQGTVCLTSQAPRRVYLVWTMDCSEKWLCHIWDEGMKSPHSDLLLNDVTRWKQPRPGPWARSSRDFPKSQWTHRGTSKRKKAFETRESMTISSQYPVLITEDFQRRILYPASDQLKVRWRYFQEIRPFRKCCHMNWRLRKIKKYM